MIQRFACDQGHHWELTAGAEDATLDAVARCPMCGSRGTPIEEKNGAAQPATLAFRGGRVRRRDSQLPRVDVPGYEIIRELGRGGMGVVYLARQLKLNRLVALKMVLAGVHADDKDRDRFLAEASAVARLRHENIVQVFEVGEADGRPFFSLEYVEGGTLGDFLDGTPLSARTAASLMLPLARAVQAAHDIGIVHRDLKPANILIQTSNDAAKTQPSAEQPRPTLDGVCPRITDFGLAKSLDRADGPTQSGAVVGTPSYMAPEQASGASRRVGPSIDVYALGAILYELLTGRPPFRAETPLDTIMLAVSQEPVRPSQLQPKCPRDLETICLKCLQKDPTKRYLRAADLAEDLQRYLNGEPIRARPVGFIGRGWRWARRNPQVASLLGILFVVLAGGLVVTSSLWLEARRERQRSLEQEARAKNNLLKAVEAVDRMLTRVVDERLAYVPQFEEERRLILEDAVRFYDEFLKQESDDPLLRREMGHACARLGRVFMTLGRLPQAINALQRAAGVLERLHSEFPNEPAYQNDLAGTLLNLAAAHRLIDHLQQADLFYHQALSIADELVKAHPDQVEFRVTRAECLAQLGYFSLQTSQLEQAEKFYHRSIEDWDATTNAKPDEFAYALKAARTRSSLAFFYQNLKQFEPAEEIRRQQIVSLEALLQKRPERRREIEPVLAEARLALGGILTETNRSAQAEENLRQGMTVFRRLVVDYPRMPFYQLNLAQGHQSAALRGRQSQHPDQTERALREAIGLLEDLDRSNPDSFFHGVSLRRAYHDLGSFLQGLGRHDEAIELAQKAVASARDDSARASANSLIHVELTRGLLRLADAQQRAGKNADALKAQEEAIDRLRASKIPASQISDLLTAQVMHALLLTRTGAHRDALAELAALPRMPRDPATIFLLAATKSLCSRAVRSDSSLNPAMREEEANKLIRSAAELIQKLTSAGYFKSPARTRELHRDPDLEPLRADLEFRRWLDATLPLPPKD